MASKQLINLHFIAGQLYVWHADEVEILRRDHHIVGSLVGALPAAPRQNTQLGLPLQLMPEEAAVLLQHGVARLVSMSVAKPSKLQVEEFNHGRMMSIKEQKRLWQEHQIEQREQLKDVIEEGRRRKKERKKQMKQEQNDVEVKTHNHHSEEKPEKKGAGDTKVVPQAMEVKGDVDNGPGVFEEEERGEDMLVVEDGKDRTRETLERGNEPSGEDQRKEHGQSKEEKAQWSQNHKDSENSRTLCNDSNLPEAEPSHSRIVNSINNNKESLLTTDKGNASMINDNKAKENIVTNREDSLSDKEDKEEKLQERTREAVMPSALLTSVVATSLHVAGDPVVSSPQVASEAVTSSPHVTSECFADEENDEEGKSLKERKATRPSVEDEDSVKDDGCSIQIFTAEPADSKFILEAPTSSWRYPSTDREKLKCRVFRHFWEMGYYLTSGTKFGGDFLVYPGDPVLFHSYFIVVCLPHHKQLSPLELISHGRLGTFVKKAVVLCSVDSHDEVVCTSLQWAGLS